MNTFVFGIIAFEAAILLIQLIRYYERPQDKKRFRFLILLAFLLLFNLCKKIFPDEDISISMGLQSAIIDTVVFFMTVYFGYFFYYIFELKHLKFFVPNKILFSVPFVALFLLPEFDKPFRSGITPFLFSSCIIYCATRLLVQRFAQSNTETKKVIVSAYIAFVCWAVIPVFSSLINFQKWDFIFINIGFIGMAFIYVQSSITEVKRAYAEIESLKHAEKIEAICVKYQFTRKEIEIANLIVSGHPSRKIAEKLYISQHTVNKHISNIFRKANINNRHQLVEKLKP
ncbi:MAG TPA: helix-turn-helix transcriptional regulator [Cyclobacteriaceae bacterium]|nr:helix-turn-helix transcriptional regulator [Cyclobacteriaceae bacterium]